MPAPPAISNPSSAKKPRQPEAIQPTGTGHFQFRCHQFPSVALILIPFCQTATVLATCPATGNTRSHRGLRKLKTLLPIDGKYCLAKVKSENHEFTYSNILDLDYRSGEIIVNFKYDYLLFF